MIKKAYTSSSESEEEDHIISEELYSLLQLSAALRRGPQAYINALAELQLLAQQYCECTKAAQAQILADIQLAIEVCSG
jgi:hypothetical protein